MNSTIFRAFCVLLALSPATAIGQAGLRGSPEVPKANNDNEYDLESKGGKGLGRALGEMRAELITKERYLTLLKRSVLESSDLDTEPDDPGLLRTLMSMTDMMDMMDSKMVSILEKVMEKLGLTCSVDDNYDFTCSDSNSLVSVTVEGAYDSSSDSLTFESVTLCMSLSSNDICHTFDDSTSLDTILSDLDVLSNYI